MIISLLTRNIVLEFLTANRKVISMGNLWKEILPKLLGLFFLYCSFITLLHSTSSFLGYSDPSMVDLGRTIAVGRNKMYAAPWSALWPGLALLLVCLSFTLIAHGFTTPLKPGLENKSKNEFNDSTFILFLGDFFFSCFFFNFVSGNDSFLIDSQQNSYIVLSQ